MIIIYAALLKWSTAKRNPLTRLKLTMAARAREMDAGNSYHFKSKLHNEPVITDEHQKDYVQITIAGLSWSSTEPSGGAGCTVGGWGIKEGPICSRYGNKPSINNMECCFPCNEKT